MKSFSTKFKKLWGFRNEAATTDSKQADTQEYFIEQGLPKSTARREIKVKPNKWQDGGGGVWIRTIKCVCKWLAAACAFLFIVGVLALNFMFPTKHAGIINAHAEKYGVDSSLVYAVVWTESKFDSGAVSSAGAVGLMQLMPKTAEWCAMQTGEKYAYESLFNPDFNIKMGTYYLSYLIGKYGEDNAIAAYNAGEGNLLSWQGSIEFKETRDFVKRVGAANKIYRLKLGRG